MALKDIKFKCPVTDKEIVTNMNVEEENFDSIGLKNIGYDCEHCGQNHVFQKEDAYI